MVVWSRLRKVPGKKNDPSNIFVKINLYDYAANISNEMKDVVLL